MTQLLKINQKINVCQTLVDQLNQTGENIEYIAKFVNRLVKESEKFTKDEKERFRSAINRAELFEKLEAQKDDL